MGWNYPIRIAGICFCSLSLFFHICFTESGLIIAALGLPSKSVWKQPRKPSQTPDKSKGYIYLKIVYRAIYQLNMNLTIICISKRSSLQTCTDYFNNQCMMVPVLWYTITSVGTGNSHRYRSTSLSLIIYLNVELYSPNCCTIVISFKTHYILRPTL